MPEIISALSFALDLTEGADPGHAVRTTLIGMRIGMALGLPHDHLGSLYYALQLKDIGCSSNAARMAQLFGGDDRRAKALARLTDWSGLLNGGAGQPTVSGRIADLAAGLKATPRNLRSLWDVVLPGAGVRTKLQRLSYLSAGTETNTRELIDLRCDRGGSILRKLRLNDLACEAVRHLDERWDGSGYPDGISGQNIPVLARIIAIAQNLDVFATAEGVEQSVRTLQRRSGSWFDPEIVRAAVALHRSHMLWQACEPGYPVERTRDVVVSLSPHTPSPLLTDEVDIICEAFADVVDAKSPFTFRHSIGVTEATVALAEELGLSPEQRTLLKRAALLHDLGKLGISNTILDKPGALTPEERASVMLHPGMSQTILARIPAFRELARIAGEHHERLDGSGYPHGLKAPQLCIETRLLAMADCFAALAEERPYRPALPLEKVLSILRKDVPEKLDAQVFEALNALVGRWSGVLPDGFHAVRGAACDVDPGAMLRVSMTAVGQA